MAASLITSPPLSGARHGRAQWRASGGAQVIAGLSVALVTGLIAGLFQGHPWQGEAHMLSFAGLALLAVLADWRAVLIFAAIAASYPLLAGTPGLDGVLPAGSGPGRAVFHGAILMGAAGALILCMRRADRLREMAATAAEKQLEDQGAARQAVQDQTGRDQSAAEAHAQALACRDRVISTIRQGLERLAQGDLRQPIESPAEDPFPAEFDGLRQAYNQLLAQIDGLVVRIELVADALKQDAGEIGASAASFASTADQQASMLEGGHQAMERIQALLGAAQDTSKAAALASRNNESHAHAGHAVAAEAIVAMQAIEEGSAKVTRIIGVIEDIAFQTSLLALNAGVEAARAGDAGRGFAVVASEVRGLAERASTSAREIRDLLTAAEAQVETGVGLVRQTSTSLSDILAQAGELRHLLEAISSSSQEQSLALAAVRTAIDGLSNLTRMTVAATGETTASAADILNQSDELVTTLSNFLSMSQPAGWAMATDPAPAGGDDPFPAARRLAAS